MATDMEMKARWEGDGRRHIEKELPATKARQGSTGRRILTVLVSALVLAFIVWIPVEIWGSYQAAETSQPLQTEAPAAGAKTAP